MKVLYDHQGFMQRYGGVSRYFVEVVGAMRALDGFEATIPPFFTDNQYLKSKRTLVTSRPFKGKIRIMSGLNKRVSRRFLRSSYDIFHPTYFDPYFLPIVKSPFVVTVHDMTHHLFGDDFVRDDGTKRNLEVLCRAAARIIAVSESTKKDILRLLGTPDEKVEVIHHGTNLSYDGGPRLHQRPYILYVGDRGGYKNFAFFASSAAGLLHESGGLDLLCVGSRLFTDTERRLLEGAQILSQVFHKEIETAEEMATLYHHAAALCYPSLYEGFGMPLLEAFSCGCPVVASRIPAFCEVAGTAAEYFDPRDALSLDQALRKVVFDPERARQLAGLGRERVKLFTWEKAAQSTLQVYRSALQA